MLKSGNVIQCILLAVLVWVQPVFAGEIMTIAGPNGPLEGEAVLLPAPKAGIIIVPGSGPTDRDGNGPVGLNTDSYKLLAEALSQQGFSSLRIDKRGFFGSSKAISDPEDVTIADYAADLENWQSEFAGKLSKDCVWIAGHSEGGLVALVAAADGMPACGLILLATPGRRISDLMREQFRNNPANAPYLTELNKLVSSLELGEIQDVSDLSPEIAPLFGEGSQRYMIQLFAYDPVQIASNLQLPVLIVQGEKDLQVSSEDASLLAGALPQAMTKLVPDMTHMLKSDVPGAPFATYQTPSLPLDKHIAGIISSFIEKAGN